MNITLKAALIALVSLTSAAALAATKPAPGPSARQNLARDAKLSLGQARAAALKARPGEITDQELEKEAGGSGLRYAFDIRSHGKVFEVGIDAVTGKVLENAAETPAEEARELRAGKAVKR